MNPITAYGQLQKELMEDKLWGSFQLSLPVKICLKSLTAVHWVWWMRRKKKLYDKDMIVPAMLGTITDFGLKLAPEIAQKITRGVAKVFLICARVDECFQRIHSLGNAFHEWKAAIKNDFPLLNPPQWITSSKSKIFSVKTVNEWKNSGKNLSNYVKRIYYATLNLFVKLFKLSMQLWDTYDAFIYSKDDVPEMFVNAINTYRLLSKSKKTLNQKLEEYQPMIQKLLDLVNSPILAKDILFLSNEYLIPLIGAAEKIDVVFTSVKKGTIRMAKHTSKVVIHTHKILTQGMITPAHTPFVLNSTRNK